MDPNVEDDQLSLFSRTKGLSHGPNGLLTDQRDFGDFGKAIERTDTDRVAGRWEPDAWARPPVPRLRSCEFAAEMGELYWMALCRDWPIASFMAGGLVDGLRATNNLRPPTSIKGDLDRMKKKAEKLALELFLRSPICKDIRQTESWRICARIYPTNGNTSSPTRRLPLRVGYGTFLTAYQTYEHGDAVIDRYINHAHNDYLELVFEGGLPALVLIAAFLILLLLRVARTIRLPLHRVASLAVCVLLVHSLVDYPLRTMALSVTFCLLLGLLFNVGAERRPVRGASTGGIGKMFLPSKS